MTFLVELYLAAAQRASVSARASAVRALRLRRSIYVPQDETCFLLCDVESADIARIALDEAAISYDRILEAIEDETQEGS